MSTDDDGNDRMVATIVDSEIFSGARVLFVAHYAGDGGWEFLGSCQDPEPLVVALKNVWAAHPDTLETKDLPHGWQAWRSSPEEPWTREPIPTEENLEQLECKIHGVTTPVTLVCAHLRTGYCCGFQHSGDGPHPPAWCDLCEAMWSRGGRSASVTPGQTPVCTQCYDDARTRNRRSLAPIRSGQLEVTDDEFAALSRVAYAWCNERQDVARKRWAFDKAKRWFFDPEPCTLRFYDDEDRPGVVADVVIAGSFSRNTGTWVWAWGNDAYSEEQRARAEGVAVFGKVRGIRRLSIPRWEARESDCWDVAQIAAYLFSTDAIYCAPMDHLDVFMLLRDMRAEVWIQ